MKTTLQQPHTALRLFAGLLFIFMAASASVANTSPPGEGWDGETIASELKNDGNYDGTTPKKAIPIKDAAELAYLAQQLNNGEILNDIFNSQFDTSDGLAGRYFILTADIDLNGHDWTPIGNSEAHPFKGHFDGNGHVIKGLKVNVSETNEAAFAGLFGHIVDGTLRNLGMWLAPEGVKASSSQSPAYAGGLVGYIGTTGSKTPASIRNCYVEAEGNGAVSSSGSLLVYAGGIVGVNRTDNCTITHCYATVDVETEATGGQSYAGGIAGQASNISYTYATGKVKGKGNDIYTGGICGYISGIITNNVALNKEIISSINQPNRIVGNTGGSPTLTSNYATPHMTINGQPATSGTTDPTSNNGADTWTDKLYEDLLSAPAENNGWKTAWTWTDGQLPQLKMENTYTTGYSATPMPNQKTRMAADFLSHSPWANNIASAIENAIPDGASEPGDGLSPDSPILIKNAAELAYLAQQVNEHEGLTLNLTNGDDIDNTQDRSKYGFYGYYFALSDNIELDGGLWTPIGQDHYFQGNFDGKGHIVDGLRVEVATSGNIAFAGLFGNVMDGRLCNLGVCLHEDGIKASGSKLAAFAGGIVGQLQGRNSNALLRNCYVVGNGKVEITAGQSGCAGGIAGTISFANSNTVTLTLTLTHCYATVDVEATTDKECYAGGIAGYSSGTLSYTYTTGSVKTNGGTDQSAGGICGRRSGGEQTHNLALNSKVTVAGGSNAHRILGYDDNPNTPGLSANYANPSMSLSSQTFAYGPGSLDGANTWSDQFSNDLQDTSAPSPGEWTTAWHWPDNQPGQSGLLPQLKLLNPDGTPHASDLLAGQPSLAVSDYLARRPDPTSSIENKDGGDGLTATTPIRIRTADELAYFARQVNDGGQTLLLINGKGIDNTDNSRDGFADYYFALSEDIDLKGVNWTPIGTESKSFHGHFDGDGHVVKGLKVHSTTISRAGLFGRIKDGTLRNLGVRLAPDGINISSSASASSPIYAGGLVGTAQSTSTDIDIRNCYVEAEGNGKISVKGNDNVFVGGIVGFTSSGTGLITQCYTIVDVEAISDKSSAYAGGIIAQDNSKITMSYTYATGNVKAEGKTYAHAGGICGSMFGTIANSLALNKSVSCTAEEEDANIARIAGSFSFGIANFADNYANPRMTLNGSTATGDNANNMGISTWSNKLKEDLLKEPAIDNEWKKAWEWTDGELPQLKKVNTDNTYGDKLAGQTPHSIKDYLSHSPWADMAATEIENEGGGNGSFGNPILIKDAAELAYLAQQVNEHEGLTLNLTNGDNIDNAQDRSKYGFSGYYFALSDNIELDGGLWTPIGQKSYFQGNFDGKGHIVDGLRVEVATGGNTITFAGLFGNLIDGTLCNLGVCLHEDGIKASASNLNTAYAGGIVGQLRGYNGNALLRNCYVVGNGKVEITAGQFGYAGGIAGIISFRNSNSNTVTLTLTHCYATIDVEVTTDEDRYAGGIAGYSDGTLSYTYATGSVKTNGGINQYAGGICGRRGGGEQTHNLALNSEVRVAGGSNAHRVVGYDKTPSPGLSANYARPSMLLNKSTVSGTSYATFVTSLDDTSLDGADTWLDTFADDLTKTPDTGNDWNSGAWTWPAAPSTLLPKLALVILDASGTATGYEPWPVPSGSSSPSTPSGSLAQPDIDAADYLTDRPVLHIIQPAEGGTLAVYDTDPAAVSPSAPGVTAPAPTPLADGTPVAPGTTLWLTNTPEAGYDFEAYLSGPAPGNVAQSVSGQSLTMTAADLWITATFTAQAPTPPPTPVYHTVTLPSVEGVTTDPPAGSYSVEAWESFRFFLTLDEAYSQSQPVVTTDRGETLTPRLSDGAYQLKNVRSDVSISIAGIVENDPVANEPIAAPSDALRIWTEPGTLCIDLDITNGTSTGTDTDTVPSVRIISADGRLLHDFRPVPGLNRRNLAPGLYIVQAGQTVRKVIVK